MRPYPEYVRRRKGVVFGMLAKKEAKTAEEAVRFLSKAYPAFAEYHDDLAAEWIERQTGAKGRRKRRRRAKATPGRKVTRGRVSKQGGEPKTGRQHRGRPRDADRVIAGCSASALKTLARAFSSSESFLEVQKAIEQLGGPANVLELFKVFDR